MSQELEFLPQPGAAAGISMGRESQGQGRARSTPRGASLAGYAREVEAADSSGLWWKLLLGGTVAMGLGAAAAMAYAQNSAQKRVKKRSKKKKNKKGVPEVKEKKAEAKIKNTSAKKNKKNKKNEKIMKKGFLKAGADKQVVKGNGAKVANDEAAHRSFLASLREVEIRYHLGMADVSARLLGALLKKPPAGFRLYMGEGKGLKNEAEKVTARRLLSVAVEFLMSGNMQIASNAFISVNQFIAGQLKGIPNDQSDAMKEALECTYAAKLGAALCLARLGHMRDAMRLGWEIRSSV